MPRIAHVVTELLVTFCSHIPVDSPAASLRDALAVLCCVLHTQAVKELPPQALDALLALPHLPHAIATAAQQRKLDLAPFFAAVLPALAKRHAAADGKRDGWTIG